MTGIDRRQQYWRSILRISGAVLGLWAAATFAVVLSAGELRFTLFGWPFDFWMASQGALVIYVALVWVYAGAVERLDGRQIDERAD